MRFIVYAKLPDCVDLLPLDIIDDRPSRNVLEEILVIAQVLPPKNSTGEKYTLKKSSVELDLDSSLADNKIKNGDVLEIVVASEQVSPSANRLGFEKVPQQENISKAMEMVKDVTQIPSKAEREFVPGKKIDFD